MGKPWYTRYGKDRPLSSSSTAEPRTSFDFGKEDFTRH